MLVSCACFSLHFSVLIEITISVETTYSECRTDFTRPRGRAVWQVSVTVEVPGIVCDPICIVKETAASRGNGETVCLYVISGRVIAQAVSRRLTTAAAPVRAQVRSCGICGGQSVIGAGFFQVLRFPLPILIPPTAPHSSSSIIRGWYNRTISGRRTKWTRSHLTPRN
jgi:hypothetical protein